MSHKGSGERGSALLIVFLFAAIVAISLYMEIPVAAFEAQRQKEQLLISRGHEYEHAIKLFVRKTGRYPNSLKDLNDTNRMRFIRHDFADPFTGKKDWRLLHAGPGGVIIDSKVKGGMLLPGMQPQKDDSKSGMPTSTASFGGSFGSNDSFAKPPQTADTKSNTADATPPEVIVKQPKQRAPAVAANGSAPASSNPNASADAALAAAMALPPLPGLDPQQQKTPKRLQGAPQNGASQTGAAQNGVSPNAAGQAPADANGAPDMKSAMLSATNTAARMGGTGSQMGQMGTVQSGGIAGVASKAGGHSIKTVNDQDDYSLWEFYYDPRKDTVPGGVQAGQYAQQQNGAQQQNATQGGTNSSFGQGSSFGNSSFGQSAPANPAPAPDGANPNPSPTAPEPANPNPQ